MTTRLGFANTYDNARNNLLLRQTNLSNLQENLTSGKKVVRSSDDPTGAAQAERALTRLSRIQTDQRALESQRNSITMAESTLGDITGVLQSFRELTVSAGNGIQTAAERKTIAIQLTGLRDQVFAFANRKDTNGLSLFGALGSALAPFVGPSAPPADYRYDGLPGQSASSEVSIPFTLDGDSAFMHQPGRDGVYNLTVSNTVTGVIPAARQLVTDSVNVPVANPPTVTGLPYKVNITGVTNTTVAGSTTTNVTYDVYENPSDPFPGGNAILSSGSGSATYPAGQPARLPITGVPGMTFNISGAPAVGDTISIEPNPSIFSVLDDAIRDIGGAPSSNAAVQAVSQALNNIDIGMARISAVRGQAGDLLNRADRISSNQEVRSIQLEADRSRAEDLNMIKGVSDFQNQNTGYQAALQSYAQIQKLSLFNYIG